MSLNFSLEGHNGKVAIFKNIKFIHEMMCSSEESKIY